MSKLYGIICPTGRMMTTLGVVGGIPTSVPAWYTDREELHKYFCPSIDKVVILFVDTLAIVIEDEV